MNNHRLYQGNSEIPGDNKPITLIELEYDAFVEVDAPRMSFIDESAMSEFAHFINEILDEERESKTMNLRMASRYFKSMFPIPDLRLVGTITHNE